MSASLKIAYLCEPQIGGTFSFFQALRPALAARGIELTCVPPVAKSSILASRFRETSGLDMIEVSSDPAQATEQLVRHVVDAGYNMVLTLPSSGVVAAGIAPYLPPEIRCVMRVPMMSRGAYAPTQAVAGSLDHVVGVSKRVADDLVEGYGIPPSRITAIYNGVDVSMYPARSRYALSASSPVVLFTGRLTDLDKGVLLLPPILAELRKRIPNATLWVAGQGDDREKLESQFAARGISSAVRMLGAVSHEQIHELYYQADCYLLPSRFEGCPNALMEAMASGCASVAPAIKGSVAEIVVNGKSGLLFPVADAAAAAKSLAELLSDEALRRRVGEGGRARIHEAFSSEITAQKYQEMLRKVAAREPVRRAARSTASYVIPQGMKPTWRTKIPVPVKNVIRKWMERMGRSV